MKILKNHSLSMEFKFSQKGLTKHSNRCTINRNFIDISKIFQGYVCSAE